MDATTRNSTTSPPPSPESRPVGGTEYSWCRAVPGGTGITVLALLLSHPIDPSALQSALHVIQTSHPILRATLTTTTNPPTISIPPSPHLLVDSLPAPATAFHDLVELEMNRNPWSTEPDGPVAFATTYQLSDPGRAVVALRFHTAFCDRASAVAVLKELMELIGGEGRGVSGTEGRVLSGIEDLIPAKDSWKPFWARGMDLVGYSLNGLRTSGLRFEVAGSPPTSSEMVRMVIGVEDTRRILNACKVKGIKLCVALSAAVLLAVYLSKNLPKNQAESYSIATLIDCRKYLDPPLNDQHFGFYHSAVLNTYRIQGGEGLWEMAMRCHSASSTAMDNKKHLTDIGEFNFLMCKAIENPGLTPSSSLRTAVVSVFEEPVIYESSELQKRLGVEDYLGCASVHGVGPSIAIFDTIRDGRLDCACVYPSPLHSRKQIEELVDHMKKILVEGSREVEDLEGPELQ